MTISLGMSAWHLWIILGMLLIIAELIGTEFILLALGVAALFTGLLTLTFGLSLNMQLLTVTIAAIVFLPLFIRFYRRRFRATGTKAVISEGAWQDMEFVIERYGERCGLRIQGDFYPARSTEGDLLRPGELVRVLEMSGVTAIVERI